MERAPEPQTLARMARALAHRGPDDQGVQCGQHWGLASRRLAIIGVDSGHQPLSNEDGTVWVAFNGEIYNHHELRAQLRKKGHVFSSTADTEVLVHLYEEYAENLVDRLEGMFALAIVDTAQRALLLARDRLGQKPLLYAIDGSGTIRFASEMQALGAGGGMDPELDPRALRDYLTLGYIPAPRTVYRRIAKLPPASVLTVTFGAGEARLKRYWHPRFEPKEAIPFRDAVAATRELIEKAVAKRLESEVPLGAFLSGGIDSTAVVALMQQMLEAPVHTFTIGFQQKRYDERDMAALAARHIGTVHAGRLANPEDAELLRMLLRHCGEPFCDSSILPTALLSRFTRETVTVALSGDGGDELFGGYERYRVMALHRLMAHLPLGLREAAAELLLTLLPVNRRQRTWLATGRRFIQALGGAPLETYLGFQGIFSPEASAELLTLDDNEPAAENAPLDHWIRRLERGSAKDAVERFLELDMLEYLPGDLLCKVDIASMMASLEVRSPFLDHELVDFVCRLPRAYKVGLTSGKRLLRSAVADVVPDTIRQRTKRGFGVPICEWLRADLADSLREMVLWQEDWDPQGLFDNAVLRRLAEEHLNRQRDHSAQLWAMLCFRIWRDEMKDALAPV